MQSVLFESQIKGEDGSNVGPQVLCNGPNSIFKRRGQSPRGHGKYVVCSHDGVKRPEEIGVGGTRCLGSCDICQHLGGLGCLDVGLKVWSGDPSQKNSKGAPDGF